MRYKTVYKNFIQITRKVMAVYTATSNKKLADFKAAAAQVCLCNRNQLNLVVQTKLIKKAEDRVC